MLKRHKNLRGFTLVELLMVLGGLAMAGGLLTLLVLGCMALYRVAMG